MKAYRHYATITGVAISLTASGLALAASTLSPSDQDFAATVWQGQMFAVDASKIAEAKAHAPHLKSAARLEERNQLRTRDRLIWIASQNSEYFPSDLSADYQSRLDRLNALSDQSFDSAYAREMNDVHSVELAAFAKETQDGQNADLKVFAANAASVFARHASE
jgi:putative membrane protein